MKTLPKQRAPALQRVQRITRRFSFPSASTTRRYDCARNGARTSQTSRVRSPSGQYERYAAGEKSVRPTRNTVGRDGKGKLARILSTGSAAAERGLAEYRTAVLACG